MSNIKGVNEQGKRECKYYELKEEISNIIDSIYNGLDSLTNGVDFILEPDGPAEVHPALPSEKQVSTPSRLEEDLIKIRVRLYDINSIIRGLDSRIM